MPKLQSSREDPLLVTQALPAARLGPEAPRPPLGWYSSTSKNPGEGPREPPAKGHKSVTPVSTRSTAHDDRRLLARYQRDGDERAREELVERFMPRARQLARRFQRGREPLDDLVQVASVGLVKAIDRFDARRATAFSTYAVPTMIGELKRYCRDFGWAVHVSRGIQERSVAVQSAVARLSKVLGRSPSAADVAEVLGLDEEQVLEALEAALAYDTVSLEAPRGGDDGSAEATVGDKLGEDDRRYELVELGVSIAPAFRDLAERERGILRMRFVDDMTQSEIAGRIGVSQMHVSRLIRSALVRLAQ